MSHLIEINNNRDKNVNILGDVFESFIGALFLDIQEQKKDAYSICSQFIINIIEAEIDFADKLHSEINYKDSLLQFYHKQKYNEPTYVLLEVIGQDTQRQFRMGVKGPNGNIIGEGIGTSKKKGEQIAAQQALIYFGVIKENDDSDDEIVEIENDIDDEIICIEDDDD